MGQTEHSELSPCLKRHRNHMHSLESKIRDFMLTISHEQDLISKSMVQSYDRDRIHELAIRKERLSRLSSLCLLNIDREIDFFKNN